MKTPGRSAPALRSIAQYGLALLLACLAWNAHADVFRPAYLELREAGEGRYDVMWKVPAQGESRLAVQVRFPENTTQVTQPQGVFSGNAYVERWRISRPGGLAGQALGIDGIASGVTDVIVRIERQDGSSQVERLLPQRPEFTVEGTTGAGEVAWSYLILGIEHILGGVDHLLFVLALLLIVRGGKRIFFTITAFTIAHSITLVAATFGWFSLPGAPVEATIALSIVFLAREIAMSWRGKVGLTERLPWLVAFAFGLLHGLGFAGALAEIGLPQAAIPLALLCFNVGVEVGQLMFVAAVLGVAFAMRRWSGPWQPLLGRLSAYAIGAVASFWMIERVAAFWA